MTQKFDVAIIGAGPAGLTLALELERKFKVLLIDKKQEPHKLIACAEWVPPNMPVAAITDTVAMETYYGDKIKIRDFGGKIIDRQSWQKGMLESLTETTVNLGLPVEKIDENKVITPKGMFEAEIVVGADGPLSVVRKSLGLTVAPVMPAINVKMKLVKKLDRTLIHFSDNIEKGYGWVFPKGEFANVGIGATSKIYDALESYKAYLVKNEIVYPEEIQRTAGLIPLYGFSPIASNNCVMVGDAAGLTDPLTGAGIFQAWDSAKILAGVLSEGKTLSEYFKKIKIAYGSFLARRMTKRKILEDNWGNLEKAVEESWVSFGK